MTNIQWTEKTWNPVRGCSRVSEGCRNCYAETFAGRFSGPGKPWEGFTKKVGGESRWTGKVGLVPSALEKPLKRKKPTTWFVNSMSDLFHEALPFEHIAAVFGVMAACPQHTFQALTKRPERMVEWFEWAISQMGSVAGLPFKDGPVPGSQWEIAPHAWPLSNVWLGVSVEDQATADERIPLLLQVPAAVRFVSAEPLLEEVDFSDFLESESKLYGLFHGGDPRAFQPDPAECTAEEMANHKAACEAADNGIGLDLQPGCKALGDGSAWAGNGFGLGVTTWRQEALSWIIVGGESGPNARPCDIAWLRSIVRQCQEAGVPVFVKQLGNNPEQSSQEFGNYSLAFSDPKGGNPSEWPEDLRVREFPRGMQAVKP